MTNEEIALQLTLKALECGRIEMHRLGGAIPEKDDRVSPFNMKLICDAYKAALKELNS